MNLRLAIALVLVSSPVLAELPPLIPRAVLFGNPERTNAQISPDGARLAYVAPDAKGVLQIWVRALRGDEQAKVVTADKKRGIRNYGWTEDGKGLLYVQDTDGDENFHVHGVDLATGNVRDYTPIQGVRADLVAARPAEPDVVLVQMNARSRAAMDVYRVTLSTGALVLDTENTAGDVSGWVVDRHLNVRGAEVSLPDGGTELRVRDDRKSAWRVLAKAGPDDNLGLVGFSPDGRSAYVQSSLGSDKTRLLDWPLDGAPQKLLAGSDEADLDQAPLSDLHTGALLAVPITAERRHWTVLDKSLEADFAGLQKLSDGDFAIASRTLDDSLWVVQYTRDRGSPRAYLWDRKAKTGKLLFAVQPKLEGLSLAKDEPVSFKARDGMQLHGYLSLPPGIAPEKLPTVLLVHGGPWARDYWGYNPYAQWLANRGYAVLQINYRGSTGYGKAYVNAGNRQWGKTMHTDLLDGLEWLAGRGLTDPARVAVFGGSYGGYAALAAAAFTPDRFACNVDIVGPSNLKTLIGSIPPYWKPIRGIFDRRMGNPDNPEDAELIKEASPLFKADQIKKPLLIGQGANDPRVNQRESEQIVAAIEKNGGKVTYVLYPDEGHGFRRAENNMDFNARSEEFLAACLKGRAEPLEGERVAGATAIVKVVGK